MEDFRGISRGPKESIKISIQKKYLILTLFVVVLLILFSGGFGLVNLIENNFLTEKDKCGDGTLSGVCSLNKPYFCSEGYLIENAGLCGCYDGQTIQGNVCISQYQTVPKDVKMKYVLNGREHYLNFTVYSGFMSYLSKVPRTIAYDGKELPSRLDFKLKIINEEEQKKMLLPLVAKIQNLDSDKEDQVRIAISLVQNIPYENSNKKISFGGNNINYSRYPYEVVYNMRGICGEKTELLAFLVRELGYGTSFFYYPEENHEAFGIKCPLKESLEKTNYCFVETTGSSIITDNKIYYVGLGQLSSIPEIYIISEGESLQENMPEYEDADKLIELRNSRKYENWFGLFERISFERLKNKYELADEYRIG